MITQRDLDLIADPTAFAPEPVRGERYTLGSWVAGIGFVALLAVLVLAA